MMSVMMPGMNDSYAHRYEEPEWQRIERYQYCSKEDHRSGNGWLQQITRLFRSKK